MIWERTLMNWPEVVFNSCAATRMSGFFWIAAVMASWIVRSGTFGLRCLAIN